MCVCVCLRLTSVCPWVFTTTRVGVRTHVVGLNCCCCCMQHLCPHRNEPTNQPTNESTNQPTNQPHPTFLHIPFSQASSTADVSKFYLQLGLSGVCWFVAFPLCVYCASFIPPHKRHRIVTVGAILAQVREWLTEWVSEHRRRTHVWGLACLLRGWVVGWNGAKRSETKRHRPTEPPTCWLSTGFLSELPTVPVPLQEHVLQNLEPAAYGWSQRDRRAARQDLRGLVPGCQRRRSTIQ